MTSKRGKDRRVQVRTKRGRGVEMEEKRGEKYTGRRKERKEKSDEKKI